MANFKRSFRFKKKIDIGRVISKLAVLVLTLWVGNEILNAVAVAMNGTSNIFSQGLTLIGFNSTNGVMDGTVSSGGLISIVGIVAVASLVLEFVEFKLR
jgi:hypothetical protein